MHAVTIGLSVVIFGLRHGQLHVLCVGQPPALPFGPFDPKGHRTFDLALRDFVTHQAGFDIGYVEQLYTFGDLGRSPGQDRQISVGYMALTPQTDDLKTPHAGWLPVAGFFPWEYAAPPADLHDALSRWARSPAQRARRIQAFNDNPERVLDRYELMYEAGLVAEAGGTPGWGQAMTADHRRILATALSRLRAKIRYRPVIYELMPETFTLSDLQSAVEAITGLRLHKQNFRRAVLATGHVTATGQMRTTSGRPAALYALNPAGVIANPSAGLAYGRV